VGELNISDEWYLNIFKELFEILKYNYINVDKEFQCIYNLHELLITLILEYLINNQIDLTSLGTKEFRKLLEQNIINEKEKVFDISFLIDKK
jgi:hypothetical protein